MSRSSSTASSRTTASCAKLIAEGEVFASETDAEVVAHLVRARYTGISLEAVRAVHTRARGPLRVPGCPPRPAGASWSGPPPLPAVGRRRRRRDVPRLVDRRVRRRHAPGDADRRRRDRRDHAGRCARYSPRGRAPSTQEIVPIAGTPRPRGKGGYDTYMLKEINEQPEAVSETIARMRARELSCARRHRRPRSRSQQPAADRHRRVRHRVPRRPRRALRRSRSGRGSRANRTRERVALSQPSRRRTRS